MNNTIEEDSIFKSPLFSKRKIDFEKNGLGYYGNETQPNDFRQLNYVGYLKGMESTPTHYLTTTQINEKLAIEEGIESMNLNEE